MRVAAVLALMALGVAPVVEAATHGPASVMAEAAPSDAFDHGHGHGHDHGHDHGHGHAHAHGQHDAADHDHSASVILPAAPVLALPQGKAQAAAVARQFAGTAADGLRRPPRA